MTAGTIRSYNVSDLSHKGHHSDRLAGHLTHFRLRTYSEGSTVDIWLFKRQTPLLRIYVTAYLRNIQPLGGYFRIMVNGYAATTFVLRCSMCRGWLLIHNDAQELHEIYS